MIDYSIEDTTKRRYEIFISTANTIWKLEKEKADLREIRERIYDDLRNGSGGASDDIPYEIPIGLVGQASWPGYPAGAVPNLKDQLEKSDRAIEEVREKQKNELKKIESIIDI